MMLFAQWYFLGGLFTCLMGLVRGTYGKNDPDGDFGIALTWFMLWWIYLPTITIRYLVRSIKRK